MNISSGSQGTPANETTHGTISAIVVITERHDDIVEMHREYNDSLSRTGRDFEMIYVVDGHFRKAYQELKALKEKGERLTLIKHSRAFGEATGITSGFRHAAGNVIMTLPAYHQVEISELPKLIEGLDGNDMVVVRRWPRRDSKLNQLQTRVFHGIAKSMTGNIYNDIGCGVRLIRRRVLEEVNLYGDMHRFLPILAYKQGFRIKEIDMEQSSKESRIRTYPIGIYVRRMIDLLTVFFLTKYTKRPLRFFGLTGTASLIFGLLVTLYLVVGRIFFNVALSDRPLFLIGIIFIVLGLQIFAIGLIGEIVIFTHAREIKEYNIEEIVN